MSELVFQHSGTSTPIGVIATTRKLSFLLSVVMTLGIASGCSRLPLVMCQTTAHQQRKLNEARELMDKSKLEKAEGVVKDVLRQSPSNIEGRKFLVALYLEQGRFDDAIQQMRTVLQLNPQDTEVLTELATLLIERQRYGEAEGVIELALADDAGNASLLMMQGELRERRGADREAMSSYYRILATQPEDPIANLRIAEILVRQGRVAHAIPLLRQLIQNPETNETVAHSAQTLLSGAYATCQRWEEASEVLADLVQSGEDSPDMLYKLSYAQFRAGETAAGKKTLGELLTRNPNDQRGLELADQFAPQLFFNAPSVPGSPRVAVVPVGHQR